MTIYNPYDYEIGYMVGRDGCLAEWCGEHLLFHWYSGKPFEWQVGHWQSDYLNFDLGRDGVIYVHSGVILLHEQACS